MITHSGTLANPHSLTVAGAAQALGTECSRTCFPFNSPATRRAPQSGAHFTTDRTLLTKPVITSKLQNACISRPYRLTYQHFSNYSQIMENELNALEGKLVQLIQVSGKLRAENHQLRQELAHALSSNRQYSDKVEMAKVRLEKLLTTLPEDQT
jgi:cell division protein ZapB